MKQVSSPNIKPVSKNMRFSLMIWLLKNLIKYDLSVFFVEYFLLGGIT